MVQPSLNPEPSSTGLDPKAAALLCYLLWFVTGLVFLFIEKQSRFVKFHAVQSIAVSVLLMVINFIFGWIPIIGFVIAPASILLWIALMALAYQGKAYKLPIIGDFAEQQARKL
ncbi:DUF4870 domain-containing protein [Paenibacillus protaetiae]|uniref:DUF4870 domain-containing protein n=1 Tax=Paenibacillus protaetiae TaxID=2509456 RepID=A0A4P6EZ16_9BACL|nr:DUF4870 domain-containing protein [Paenibacillus protaetiae]QAY67513.1 hypothetical protein ET464_15075 [Paenibacillus protaetiae]